MRVARNNCPVINCRNAVSWKEYEYYKAKSKDLIGMNRKWSENSRNMNARAGKSQKSWWTKSK